MLDDRHLRMGLNALCRAHRSNYFNDGHKGAALIAATYFARQTKPKEGISDLLEKKAMAAWERNTLFADFPEEQPQPKRIKTVGHVLQAQCRTLRGAAHNWILASLALKVFADLPALATPQRVAGLVALVEKFSTITPVAGREPVAIPSPQTADAYSRFVMTEFIAAGTRFDGRGQGWTGHLCTMGQALRDLHTAGHTELAEEGRAVLEIYVRRVRVGPGKGDRKRGEKAEKIPSALTAAYWNRAGINFRLGHALKYPYGFFGLVDHVGDAKLKQRALASFWRISSIAAPPPQAARK